MFTHDGLRLPGNGANLRRRTPGLLSRLLTAGVAIVLLVGTLALSLFVIAAGALAQPWQAAICGGKRVNCGVG